MALGLRYCDQCGEASAVARIHEVDVPTCPDHGPRWVLVRTGAAADIVVQRHGRALLARRAISPYLGYWASVGGFVNPGEHPADTARREAFEELGVSVELIGILGVYVQPYRPGEWLTTTVYVGETQDDPQPDPAEVIEWGAFGPDDLPPVMAWNHSERLTDWARWQESGFPLTPA